MIKVQKIVKQSQRDKTELANLPAVDYVASTHGCQEREEEMQHSLFNIDFIEGRAHIEKRNKTNKTNSFI